MKKFSLLLMVFVLGLGMNSIYAQENAKTVPTPSGPIATFTETTIDYGTIKQNSEPLRIFKFKNTGNNALVISAAKGSCGCTVPEYPKDPILPGQESKIEVRYDTKRVGIFNKTVTLTTNAVNGTEVETPGTFVLKIKGNVEAVEEIVAPTIIPTTPE